MIKYFYKIENNKLLKGSGISIPDGFVEYDINNKPNNLLQYEAEESKSKLISEVEAYADKKTEEAEAYVAQKTKVTTNQRKRYEAKYALAVRYLNNPTNEDKKALERIGKPLSIDNAEDVAKLLIDLHEKWLAELERFNLLVDYFRVMFEKDINDNFTLENKELFDYKFHLLKQLGASATYDDIDNILAIKEIPEIK